VVGFDDIEDARYAFPSLTTSSPDKESIARLAVARLFDRMKGDEAPPPPRASRTAWWPWRAPPLTQGRR
jgi:DNA-binding LacI/PurR family transcriptional regulator